MYGTHVTRVLDDAIEVCVPVKRKMRSRRLMLAYFLL